MRRCVADTRPCRICAPRSSYGPTPRGGAPIPSPATIIRKVSALTSSGRELLGLEEEEQEEHAEYDVNKHRRRRACTGPQHHSPYRDPERENLYREISSQNCKQALAVRTSGHPINDAESHKRRPMTLSDGGRHRGYGQTCGRIERSWRK